jgi:hypothetical protein
MENVQSKNIEFISIKRHYIKEYRFKNFNKKGGSFKVNMVEKDEVRELVTMISNI